MGQFVLKDGAISLSVYVRYCLSYIITVFFIIEIFKH